MRLRRRTRCREPLLEALQGQGKFMIKKIFKWIGIILAVIILLAILIAVFIGYNAAKYEKTAVPYINEAMPALSTWDPQEFKEYLHPLVSAEITDAEFEKMTKWFAKLGSLVKFDEPQFQSVSKNATTELGGHTIIHYQFNSEYQNGTALITIQLIEKDDQLSIYNFNLNSNALIE